MADGKMITVWVTRYALTRGIKQVTGELGDRGSVRVPNQNVFGAFVYAPKDYELTKERADEARRLMIERKLRSLRRQVRRLEQLLEDA